MTRHTRRLEHASSPSAVELARTSQVGQRPLSGPVVRTRQEGVARGIGIFSSALLVVPFWKGSAVLWHRSVAYLMPRLACDNGCWMNSRSNWFVGVTGLPISVAGFLVVPAGLLTWLWLGRFKTAVASILVVSVLLVCWWKWGIYLIDQTRTD